MKLPPNSDYGPTNFTRKLVTEKWLEAFHSSGKGWLIIISDSMSPLIRTGDRVLVEQALPSNISIGDIITFWRGSMLVSHRVIRKVKRGKELFFVERGDQYPACSVIPSDLVIGKVKKIKKGEQDYPMDSFPWQLFNRIVAIGFLGSYVARMVKHSMPVFPEALRNIAKKSLAPGRRLREMFCEMLIRIYQKKS